MAGQTLELGERLPCPRPIQDRCPSGRPRRTHPHRVEAPCAHRRRPTGRDPGPPRPPARRRRRPAVQCRSTALQRIGVSADLLDRVPPITPVVLGEDVAWLETDEAEVSGLLLSPRATDDQLRPVIGDDHRHLLHVGMNLLHEPDADLGAGREPGFAGPHRSATMPMRVGKSSSSASVIRRRRRSAVRKAFSSSASGTWRAPARRRIPSLNPSVVQEVFR